MVLNPDMEDMEDSDIEESEIEYIEESDIEDSNITRNLCKPSRNKRPKPRLPYLPGLLGPPRPRMRNDE